MWVFNGDLTYPYVPIFAYKPSCILILQNSIDPIVLIFLVVLVISQENCWSLTQKKSKYILSDFLTIENRKKGFKS